MVCPNCNAEIGRFELGVHCKNCGVNLYFASQEKLLSDDAKKCELEFASMRAFTAKLKAAFIGSAPAIARIVFTVLCIAVLLIPFGSLKANLPLYDAKVSFDGLGLYNAYSSGWLLLLPDYLKVGVTHDIALKSIMLIGAVVLLALTAVAMLLAEILSFINIRKGARGMCTISVIGVIFSVLCVVFSVMISSAAKDFTVLNVKASMGFGGFVSAAMYIGMFIINRVFISRNIEPKVKEVDLQRIAVNKKLKAGEITLDELPLPVFESEEEKEERLEHEREVAEIEEKEKAKSKSVKSNAEGNKNG
ncbi:MAG: hypothetical protein MJ177_08285 [Clostridia bacterium]|nr:hypothetical protein [Clostridia bacterium]